MLDWTLRCIRGCGAGAPHRIGPFLNGGPAGPGAQGPGSPAPPGPGPPRPPGPRPLGARAQGPPGLLKYSMRSPGPPGCSTQDASCLARRRHTCALDAVQGRQGREQEFTHFTHTGGVRSRPPGPPLIRCRCGGCRAAHAGVVGEFLPSGGRKSPTTPTPGASPHTYPTPLGGGGGREPPRCGCGGGTSLPYKGKAACSARPDWRFCYCLVGKDEFGHRAFELRINNAETPGRVRFGTRLGDHQGGLTGWSGRSS